MRYEPRQRQRKWIWRIVIAAAALLILVSFLLYHFVVEPQEVRGHFQACGWGPDEIREQLEKQQEEIIELEDYLFYGESLALYMDPYDGEEIRSSARRWSWSISAAAHSTALRSVMPRIGRSICRIWKKALMRSTSWTALR